MAPSRQRQAGNDGYVIWACAASYRARRRLSPAGHVVLQGPGFRIDLCEFVTLTTSSILMMPHKDPFLTMGTW